ncbi:DUF2877 domain-containing protein [Nocardioides sp.]|uniref:oxamate carbamoyltransferase subunit AllH family protein n=1 Tax=Nocardioides sp. TaxID=35761 RepID=UPI0035B10A05
MAAPIRVQARLAAATDGPRPVLHASATAIYVDLDGWCLGLAAASATRVPCALWSTLPDLGPLAGRPVVVRDGTLTVGGEPVRIGRVVDPRGTLVGRHGRRSPGRPAAMTSPLDDLDLPADGRLTAEHVDGLLGRGPGLTPLGDDVLAGWLATRAALGRPDASVTDAVRRRLGATTLLSATLLDCAIRGEVLPELGAWLADPTATSTDALLAVGATSGAGLMTGAALAIDSLNTPRWRAA